MRGRKNLNKQNKSKTGTGVSSLKKLTVVLVTLALLMSLVLSACRESPALVEEVYVEDAVREPDQNEIETTDENEETTTDSFDNKKDDSDRADDSDDSIAVADASSDNSSNSSASISDGASGDENNSGGKAKNSDNKKTEGKDKSDKDDKDGGEKDKSSDKGETKKSDEGNQKSGESETTKGNEEAEPTSDTKNTREATGKDGKKVKVPEETNIVCAAGGAAELVQILINLNGDSDKQLVGVNSNLLNSSIGTQCFPDAEVYWNGAGTEGTCANLTGLEAAKPDVIFECGDQSLFDQGQRSEIEQDKDIAIMPLDDMDSIDNIEANVKKICDVLFKNQNAKAGKTYIKWLNDTIDEANLGETIYSEYICAWDYPSLQTVDAFNSPAPDFITSKLTNGVAVAPTVKAANQTVPELMAEAGVTNLSTTSYYQGYANKTQYMYIVPTVYAYDKVNFGESSISLGTVRLYSFGPTGSYPGMFGDYDGTSFYLGQDGANFNTIIAKDDSIAQALANNYFWQVRGYSGGSNITSEYGTYMDYVGAHGAYTIYSLPTGELMDFDQYSAETPLNIYWIGSVVHSNEGLDFNSKASEFYSKFFNVNYVPTTAEPITMQPTG